MPAARGRGQSQRRNELRWARPLELHPLADGGQVAAADAGGAADAVPAGATAGGAGSVEGAVVGRDMIGFCLSRRGKFATADVMGVTGVTGATRRAGRAGVTGP